jgi:hypothetical protein
MRSKGWTGYHVIEKVLNRLGYELIPVPRKPGKTILFNFRSNEQASNRVVQRPKIVLISRTYQDKNRNSNIPW